ncbi:unnamed protein product [Polarella glacialis]|uniref:UmuC domain-containing protein n=2 Tax=Polarella glacialis TaxID=89957 RepID=A0A813GRQ4_POLGL|nr:unnamed protein product [Polarella glacialis]CAE8713886.1 unnamed protein product [Polarella glacialis]
MAWLSELAPVLLVDSDAESTASTVLDSGDECPKQCQLFEEDEVGVVSAQGHECRACNKVEDVTENGSISILQHGNLDGSASEDSNVGNVLPAGTAAPTANCGPSVGVVEDELMTDSKEDFGEQSHPLQHLSPNGLPPEQQRQDRIRAARSLAAALRSEEPLLQGQQRTSRQNPDFVQTFFKASRLHFIGVWRERYEEILDSLPPPPALPPPSEASGKRRVVVHVDMDCFFASVAMLGREEALAGLPVAVAWGTGGSSEISTANYEARASGIRAGMWMKEAFQLCPDLVVMPYEFSRIMETAEKFYRAVLHVTPFVQGVSCDEVFADVTHLMKDDGNNNNKGRDGTNGAAATWARRIQEEIWQRSGCTASVGAGSNRLLARLATKAAKPRPGCETCRRVALHRGLSRAAERLNEKIEHQHCPDHPGAFVLVDSCVHDHLDTLPVRDLPGVGPETEKQLLSVGATSVQQLRRLSEQALREVCGAKQAHSIHSLARGIDERPWEPRPQRKSVGAQISWGVRFDLLEEAQAFCKQLTEEAMQRLVRHGARGSSLTIKVWRAKPGYCDAGGVGHGYCDIISRSAQVALDPSAGAGAINTACAESWRLFHAAGASPAEVRGLGIHITLLERSFSRPSGHLMAKLQGSKPFAQMLQPRSDASSAKRVILHLDVDTFFLAVHKRYDPSLREAGPLVLWQYNDVICISPEAKAAGVRKHMRPSEAQPMVDAIGGRMVHAFSRRWPGPRVWYGPYMSTSREMFTLLRQKLDEDLAGKYVLERASVDEAYLDVTDSTGSSLDAGAALARRITAFLHEAMGVCISVGVARNRLLAKLASVAAKPPQGDGLRVIEDSEESAQMLLQSTPVTRLPGCGSRGEQLASLGAHTAADLQQLVGTEELRSALSGLSIDVAGRIAEACHGRDGAPVRAADPKKSLVVTSWLSDACLAELAMKTREGPASVTVGNGWTFGPQVEKGVTNLTRARWLLLGLVLDMEERAVQECLEFGQLPTKLTVSYQGPGWRKEPGPGSTDGRSCSRTAAFPTEAFQGLGPADGRVDMQLSITPAPQQSHSVAFPQPSSTSTAVTEQTLVADIVVEAEVQHLPAQRNENVGPSGSKTYRHPIYGTEFLSVSGSSAVLADGPEILSEPRRGKRVAALTDAAAGLISAWAAELRVKVPIAKLTLTASGMAASASGVASSQGAEKRLRLAQPTLADCFKKAKNEQSAVQVTPCRHLHLQASVEISDSD